MHPLALEDVLSQRSHTRSKADYYPQHLFLRILCHSLVPENIQSAEASLTDLPRSESPVSYGIDDSSEDESGATAGGVPEPADEDEDGTIYGSATGSRFSTTRGQPLKHRFSGFAMAAKRRRDEEDHAMHERKAAHSIFTSNKDSKVGSVLWFCPRLVLY